MMCTYTSCIYNCWTKAGTVCFLYLDILRPHVTEWFLPRGCFSIVDIQGVRPSHMRQVSCWRDHSDAASLKRGLHDDRHWWIGRTARRDASPGLRHILTKTPVSRHPNREHCRESSSQRFLTGPKFFGIFQFGRNGKVLRISKYLLDTVLTNKVHWRHGPVHVICKYDGRTSMLLLLFLLLLLLLLRLYV